MIQMLAPPTTCAILDFFGREQSSRKGRDNNTRETRAYARVMLEMEKLCNVVLESGVAAEEDGAQLLRQAWRAGHHVHAYSDGGFKAEAFSL